MVEKLKSILKPISWSSLLKAAIFGVAWWALPFWLFLLIALYLYYIPIVGTGKVSVPFLVLLLITFLQGYGAIAAILFAVIFYFILIKDFLIIDRRNAHEVLMLVLTYLLVWNFFFAFGGAFDFHTFFYSVIVAWAVSALIAGFIKSFSEAPYSFRRMLGWVTFILMWQLLIVGLFLPLNFLYQSAIVFLIGVILINLVPQYVFGELSRTKVLVTGTVIFSLLVIVSASARWGL